MRISDQNRHQQLETLIDVLHAHATERPDALAYHFIEDPQDGSGVTLTYAELELRARRLATLLRTVADRHDRILLLFPAGLDYVVAFLGCMYAELIAVPLYPPRKSERTERLSQVINDCGAHCALGSSADIEAFHQQLRSEGESAVSTSFAWLALEQSLQSAPCKVPRPQAEDLVFLQYTSGSTGEPKGVMVSHRNLMANQACIVQVFDSRSDDRCLSWLPLYHDMGLIGAVLHPLYCGYPAYLLSPLSFIQDPLSWLENIGRFDITVSGGPNFAYDLCVERARRQPERLGRIALARWRVAFNGAEPVREASLRHFADTFGAAGFRDDAFFPCYGLAEATLLVAGRVGDAHRHVSCDSAALLHGRVQPGGNAATTLVSVGRCIDQHVLCVVDRQGCEVAPGEIGEVWISGPSVARGYWNKPELNRQIFQAQLGGKHAACNFLRTGDLGAIHDGELLVTGRAKDLIIVNGRNYYPQDIEMLACAAHPALRTGCTAAFSIEEQHATRVVLVQEVERKFVKDFPASTAASAIRAAVSAQLGVALDTVVFIAPNTIPKTSSGKIRRSETRTRYANQTLAMIEAAREVPSPQQSRPASGREALFEMLDPNLIESLPAPARAAFIEGILRKAIALELRLPLAAVAPESLLTAVGLDSIGIVQIQHGLERALAVSLDIERLFKGISIRELAALVTQACEHGPAAVVVAPQGEAFPLSYSQQQLWFTHQLDPLRTDYNLALLVECRPGLEAGRLHASLLNACQRHAILRTTYQESPRGNEQRVAAAPLLDFAEIDARVMSEPALAEQLNRIALAAFDLSRGPILRVRLATFSTHRCWLLVAVHHIASDLWSMAALIDELITAASGGVLDHLPNSSYQQWVWQQAEYLRSRAANTDRAYWQQLLGAKRLSSCLSAAFGTAATAAEPAASILNFRIETELLQRLRNFARSSGKTLNAVCLAVFQLALHLRSRSATLSIGTMSAGRLSWHFASTQGNFVNPIPLVSELRTPDSFVEFLERSAGQLADGIAHQRYPFQLLVQEHAGSGRTQGNPVFQALFLMQQAQHGGSGLAIRGAGKTTIINGIELRALPLPAGALPFELMLTMAAGEDGIDAMLEHGSGIAGEQARAFIQEYLDLLAAVLHAPATALHVIAEARRREPTGIAPAPTQPQQCVSLVEAFDRQVQRVPDKVALTCGELSLTYAQLQFRAAQLAGALRANREFDTAVPVAILLERGTDAIASILAVLYAGACYLPLDPHSPPQRLQAIVADGKPRIVITTAQLRSRLDAVAAGGSLRAVLIDEAAAAPLRASRVALADADPRAYVMFTSGSTGRPKGVQVSHRNVLRLFACCEQQFGFSERDVWTMFHSYAFDFSVWELWGALLYGGRLVIVPYEVSRSPEQFHALVGRERVTVLNQTPSAFNLFARIDAQRGVRLEHLRVVIFGGEALVFRSLQAWFEKYRTGRPVMVNMYGITETTVHTTYRRISEADVDTDASLIGTALADVTIDLLSPEGRRVAAGEVGEIVVGGAGLTLGYLDNPALTQARFPELELDPGQRRRYYKSGDLARRIGGEYEYLGRADHQVNLNGFRIELGEIETALMKFGGIRAAVVLAQLPEERRSALLESLAEATGEMTPIRQLLRRASSSERQPAAARLTAYMVCDSPPELEQLHRHLLQHLPDYMLPHAILIVASIPLNHNGKADRAALLQRASAAVPLRADYAAPRNQAERLYVKLFTELLDHPRVGVHDGFFALGGDSIRIIQLRSRALQAGLQVSVQDIFRLQTPAALAAVAQTTAIVAERPRMAPFALLSVDEKTRLPADVVDAYPLARLQEGLLFHSLYGNDIAMYCDIFEFRLRARFDRVAFERSIEALLQRHAIFRTSFHFAEFERPLQLVHQHAACRIALFDYRSQQAPEQAHFYQQWLETEKRTQYDITAAPLIRFSVHRLGEDEFILTMSFHDALLDGWSESSTVAELLGNYFGLLEHGVLTERSPIHTGFVDFVALEREAIADHDVVQFWNAELADVRPTLLPALHGESSELQQNQIRFHAVDLPAALSAELKTLAAQLGVTLKHVLLAAHAAVMSMLCGETDLLLAIESNGRLEDGDGERALGTHLNIVPWRLQLAACSWETLIKGLQEKEAVLQPYRRFPYQEIQRCKGNQQLFDVSFNYTHFHVYEELERLGELQIVDAKAYIQTHFALRVEFNQDPFSRRLTLDLEANVDRLPAERVRAIGEYYRRALSAIVQTPNAEFSSAQLLTDRELYCELQACRGVVVPSPEPFLSFITRLDQQAAATPLAIAVSDATGAVSYADLVARSRGAAAQLRLHAVTPGTVVAILADRCIDYLVTILALWRLGAIFMPLPIGPVARIAGMLARAETGLLVYADTFRHVQDQLDSAVPAVRLETLAARSEAEFDGTRVASSDLAYIIFTSGSTGEPKGVMIEHGGMLNHMDAKIHELGLGHIDQVSQDAAATFDICVWQFCAVLLVGGRVRIFEDDVAKDPGKLLYQVMREHVSILEVSPTVLSSMLVSPQSQDLTSGATWDRALCEALRWVVSSGEALQPSLVMQLRKLHPSVGILNMWGATESSDDCTHYPVPPGFNDVPRISIGRPIQNSAVYVLDHWLRPVPRGTAGDLYIGGLCVGRGYVNDASRTAAAFQRNHNDYAGHGRLYRSGDRGFRGTDGELYFLGRRDSQVKIRGHRIEIGEVETALNRLPMVQEAVVLALPDGTQQLSLFAWVVLTEPKDVVFNSVNEPALRGLRTVLKQRVPLHMVPDTMVVLAELPKNVNGKIDRNALAKLTPLDQSAEPVAVLSPRNAVETSVLALFKQVLGREVHSIDWSFFDSGGNSLLATQLTARAARQFAADVPVRALFDHDTVMSFAAHLQGLTHARLTHDDVIRSRPRPSRIPLSFNQERLLFIDSIDRSGRAYSSHFALRLLGELNVAALAWSLQQVVNRHEVLRTCFAISSEGGEQIIAQHLQLEIASVDLHSMPVEQREPALHDAMREALNQPYRLDTLPLCKASLYRLSAREHALLWRNHHIVGDGWSAGVMLREVAAQYQAKLHELPNPLPSLAIQFADYALWQREYVQSERFASQMQFWRSYLAGHGGVLELPTDFERPRQITFEGRRLAVRIPRELTAQIRGLCKEARTTLFAFLQCALALLLSRYSKDNDVLLGSPVANRRRYEIEPLIGFITNTLPIRHVFDPTASFVAHLGKVSADLLEVFENQEVPFAHLVQNFVTERDPGINPLVQVMLVLQNEDLSLPRVDGLTLEPIDIDRCASILDLLFDLQEVEDCIAGHIEFNMNLYTEQTVATLWESLLNLMRSILAGSDRPIAMLNGVGEAEYRRLSTTWNRLLGGRSEIQFWSQQAMVSPYWEDYLEQADEQGLLLSAYLAVSEY